MIDGAGQNIEDGDDRIENQAQGRTEEREEDSTAIDHGAAENSLSAFPHDLRLKVSSD